MASSSRPRVAPLSQGVYLRDDISLSSMENIKPPIPPRPSSSKATPDRPTRSSPSPWNHQLSPLPRQIKAIHQESIELCEISSSSQSSKSSIRSYDTRVDSLLSASEKNSFIAELRLRQLKRPSPVTFDAQNHSDEQVTSHDQHDIVPSEQADEEFLPPSPRTYAHSNYSFESPATTLHSSESPTPTRIPSPTPDCTSSNGKKNESTNAKMDFVATSYGHTQCSADVLRVSPPPTPQSFTNSSPIIIRSQTQSFTLFGGLKAIWKKATTHVRQAKHIPVTAVTGKNPERDSVVWSGFVKVPVADRNADMKLPPMPPRPAVLRETSRNHFTIDTGASPPVLNKPPPPTIAPFKVSFETAPKVPPKAQSNYVRRVPPPLPPRALSFADSKSSKSSTESSVPPIPMLRMASDSRVLA